MWAGKDGQPILPVGILPLRIRSSHVADKSAIRPRLSLEQKRQMTGKRLAIDLRHKEPEAILLDEIVELRKIADGKGGRNVHQSSPGGCAYWIDEIDKLIR